MHIRLTADDKADLKAFWGFYEPRAAAIMVETRAATERAERWHSGEVEASSEELANAHCTAHTLHRAAIVDDSWQPLIDSLRAEGAHYAVAGFTYAAWFEMLRNFCDVARSHLVEAGGDCMTAFRIARGMHRFVDI